MKEYSLECSGRKTEVQVESIAHISHSNNLDEKINVTDSKESVASGYTVTTQEVTEKACDKSELVRSGTKPKTPFQGASSCIRGKDQKKIATSQPKATASRNSHEMLATANSEQLKGQQKPPENTKESPSSDPKIKRHKQKQAKHPDKDKEHIGMAEEEAHEYVYYKEASVPVHDDDGDKVHVIAIKPSQRPRNDQQLSTKTDPRSSYDRFERKTKLNPSLKIMQESNELVPTDHDDSTTVNNDLFWSEKEKNMHQVADSTLSETEEYHFFRAVEDPDPGGRLGNEYLQEYFTPPSSPMPVNQYRSDSPILLCQEETKDFNPALVFGR